MTDLDGDGEESPWERNLCKVCITAALAVAFARELNFL